MSEKTSTSSSNGVPLPDRAALDAQITAGGRVAPDSLKAVLRSVPPPEGDLLRRYAELLLDHALDARDAEAAVITARRMDANPALDAALYERLNERMQGEPDAVYAFIRARLAEQLDSRWLERLKVAAMLALQIAITDGDSETASNWMRLIAREPATYELSPLVYHSIIAASWRARHEPDLARLLFILAVKRDHNALNVLLNDDDFLQAVPNALGVALRDYEGDASGLAQTYGQEILLVVLARAARAHRGALFTSGTVDQVWVMLTSGQAPNVAPEYSAEAIAREWAASGADWLEEPALQTLLTLSLRDRHDDLFVLLTGQLAGSENFLALLGNAFQRSGRSETDLLALSAQMVGREELTPQMVVDLFSRLLNTWEWRKSAQPMAQQLGRTLQQNPGLNIGVEALWHLVDIASDTRDENLVRISSKRLAGELEAVEDEALLTESITRLFNDTQWHPITRQYLVTWWRGFVRGWTLARLQRLDKVMDSKRGLDELRNIVQTIIAFRKMIGKRNLQQFAWDVGVAYGVLQALNESFEPSPKRPFTFDQATMRAELDAHDDEMTPHEQKIMANNFKELAQLISEMGDNRSKASLMRRGDDVDRLLMTGDQQPHSAVDAMKWLAGYLGGTQEKDEEDEE